MTELSVVFVYAVRIDTKCEPLIPKEEKSTVVCKRVAHISQIIHSALSEMSLQISDT